MTQTTEPVSHESTTLKVPAYGSYEARAASRYPEGSIVGRDASGRAYAYTAADVSGFPAQGVSKAYFLNVSGDPLPATGLDDAFPVEVNYGVFGFPFTGATPLPGDDLYVVDNNTLSVDSLNGTRGFAGKCAEVRTLLGVAKAFVHMGPTVAGKGGTGSIGEWDIPLTSFVDPDGDPLVKFADGASAVPGWNLADSEAFGIRWNNNAAFNAILAQRGLPSDLDDSRDAYIDLIVSKTGATVGDATTFTLTAFLLAVGALHDADANAGSVSAAIVGDAAAKTTQAVRFTLAAADIPAGAATMTLTLKPTDGTLGTDDVIIHSVKLRGIRK